MFKALLKFPIKMPIPQIKNQAVPARIKRATMIKA